MGELYLRKAEPKDAMFLYELVNDPKSRKNSLSQKHISWEEHMNWYKKSLEDDTKEIYILMEGNLAIGQGRLEVTDLGSRISYSIVADKRGHGCGEKLLLLLEEAARHNQVFSCYGEVLKHNLVSCRIFEKAGYLKEEKEEYYLFSKKL